MEIIKDDLTGTEVAELLREHLHSMTLHSPPESIHALNIEALRKQEITFWSAWEGDELAGFGALKELDDRHAEIKSMRTALSHLRKGVAKRLLQHILDEARRRCYRRVSLKRDQWMPSRLPGGSMPVLDSFIVGHLRITKKTHTASL